MDSFTNYDAQQVLNSTEKLKGLLEHLKDVNAGSGTCCAHTYAIKMLLEEILAYRIHSVK